MRSRWKVLTLLVLYIAFVVFLARFIYFLCNGDCLVLPDQELITSLEQYADGDIVNVKDRLIHRIRVQPFNLIALLIFVFAITHTFFAHYFTVLSKRLRDRNVELDKHPVDSFWVEILRFMGEVEVVFGIWVIPLFCAMAYVYDWNTAIHYVDGISYIEPLFVVVIMALTSTGPIVSLAENSLKLVAKIWGESIQAWWLVILTLGPIAGSFITEPGAMTISALLLGKHFYRYKPSLKFAYATLALLFTNISVGGVLTNFAAPPILMVRKSWDWDAMYMFENFGWKAVLGILIANMVYFLIFRHEFKIMAERKKAHEKEKQISVKEKKRIPFWISFVHVGFLAWTVVHNHYPVIFIGTFLLFLGFYQATLSYQKVITLKPAILVGFFLAGLVVHGSLQAWWIEPILSQASRELLLVLSTVLTSFNDNAEVTFMATLIPTFDETMKYAVVAGAVTGGGLTVIANAPNPTGQAILRKYFYQGISAVSLLAAALFPATVMGLCFYLL